MKEKDLANPCEKIFKDKGFETYAEVQGKWFKNRADMVATKEDCLIAIEMKTSLSFQVIDQARFWQRFADYVYIVVPYSKKERSQTAMEVVQALGIGLIEIDVHKYTDNCLRNKKDVFHWIRISPRKNDISKRDSKQFSNLTDEHKTWKTAGTKGGGYVTSYSLLMSDVYKYLRQERLSENEGWVTIDMIVKYIMENSRESVQKHYKNTKQGLTNAFKKWEVSELETVKIKNKRYYRILEHSNKYLEQKGENDLDES